MILIQTLVNRIASALDAENSDRYTFDRDYKYAINYASEYAVMLFNSIFAQKKYTSESLRELNRTLVFQTSQYSRVAFDSSVLGFPVWTIVGVYPEPEIKFAGVLPTAPSDSSTYLSTASYIKSYFSCKRLTHEEANSNRLNPFMPGNEISTCSDLKEYGYIDFSDYTNGYNLLGNKFEIEVVPEIPMEAVAVSVLKYPSQATLITGSIEFPESMTSFLVDNALKFISFKQGDNTNLYTTTQVDINNLAKLF